MDDREARKAVAAAIDIALLGELSGAACFAAADAAIASLRRSFAVVPREATDEMIMAGIAERHGQPVPEAWSLATQNIYAAMIQAAEANVSKG